MGWITIILLALAIVAGLYPFVRKDKGALQFLAAALLLAFAGYSVQGSPGQPGNSKVGEAPQSVPDDDFAILHPDLLGRFDRASYWMTLADADRREGNPLGSAQTLESAVRNNPANYALWTAYAYALVAANDSRMSPASQLAFERANRLAPEHPGPMFFYAVALTRPIAIRSEEDLAEQAARLAQAEQIWREQLQGLGTGYPLYRAAIEERLAAVTQARGTNGPIRPATPLPQTPTEGAPPGAPPAAAPPAGNSVAPAR